ncbi:MAG: glycosyltransferase [Planctomycetes bacterium]|nr:glycosyltransferase [Planctomycetota bacterium]
MKRLNVLQFICPTGFYGAERWILALANNLNPNEINCQLAVTRESDCQNLELYNKFKALGFGSHQIRMRGRFDPFVILKLVTLIKKQKIDIVHTHGYKSDVLGLLAAKIARIKAVATPHGFGNEQDIKLAVFMKFGCFALKFFDKVVPLSVELKDEMGRLGVINDRIKLIGNGVDLREIELENENSANMFSSKSNEKTMGYIGRIESGKNVKDILIAFDLLYRANQNIRLVIVGDGSEKCDLEECAKNMDSFSKMHFLGFRDDRLRLLKGFDVFCLASSKEGTPRSVMEAMAMKVPVVAYDIDGISKLIINGETGLTAEFGNVKALKIGCEKLLFNEDFSSKVARKGKEHILNHFSSERMAKEYTSLYDQLINVNGKLRF